MQLMSVDGLTRENVASHLQKYRLYLKRMKGLSGGSGGGANGGSGGAGLGASADTSTDRLFASSPVPPHFLHPGRSNSEHFLPFVPVPALQHHHHHQQQQMVAATVGHPHLQSQYHRPPMGHFETSPNSPFEHLFLGRQTQQPMHRMGGTPVIIKLPVVMWKIWNLPVRMVEGRFLRYSQLGMIDSKLCAVLQTPRSASTLSVAVCFLSLLLVMDLILRSL